MTVQGSRAAGKVALITGGAGGLGAAMAWRLVEEGAHVAIADIDLSRAKTVADDVNVRAGRNAAVSLHLDVTEEASWDRALAELQEAFGSISVLVHNAGVNRPGAIDALCFVDWKLVMSVNVDSIFLGTKAALPYLQQSTPASIVFISSVAGLVATHHAPAYSASKAAAWLLSKSIALHCAREGWDVRCNSVHPAYIDTPFLDEFRKLHGHDEAHRKLAADIPLGRLGEAADVANAVLYLASDESRFVTGSELKVDGGVTAR